MLRAHFDLRARRAPSKSNVDSINNWFFNNEGAIDERERRYINQKDLVSARSHHGSTWRQFLEDHIVFRLYFLWKEPLPDGLSEADQRTRRYASERRIDRVTTVTMLATGAAMLIVPIWLLLILASNPVVKLAIITGFIILFLVLVVYATSARPAEALAGTAA
jgi:hypothetical protein